MYLSGYFFLIQHTAPSPTKESFDNPQPVGKRYLPLNIVSVMAHGRRTHAQGVGKTSPVIAHTKVSVFKSSVRNRYKSNAEFNDAVKLKKIEPLTEGNSFCSEQDNYSRRKGLLVALNRALGKIKQGASYSKAKGWRLFINRPPVKKTKETQPIVAEHAIGRPEDREFLPGHDSMLTGE